MGALIFGIAFLVISVLSYIGACHIASMPPAPAGYQNFNRQWLAGTLLAIAIVFFITAWICIFTAAIVG